MADQFDSYKIKLLLKAKFRTRAQKTIDHRLLVPQASFSSFVFELPPHPTDSSSSAYHLLAPCTGTRVEDWMGLDIAVCAVGKVSETSFSSPRYTMKLL